MKKSIVMLNLKDELRNCNITKVLDKEVNYNSEMLDMVGYNLVEVESETTPLLKTVRGNFIPEIVHNENRFVTQWKPVI